MGCYDSVSNSCLATLLLEVRASVWSGSRFAQFLLVGLFGMFIDNAVLALLMEGWQPPLVLAALGGKEASIATMFILNELWTFAETPPNQNRWIGARLARSHLVRFIGAGVGVSVLMALNQMFGVWYLFANIIGIGAGFIFNYTLESTITWQVHRA
ncbi:GtrA family protein [Halocatena pleomorpha]|uniref:GtrA family protein n=1 Tax=Halocatena pleomorpha TaxID=1785090 RepID=A0A3P3RCA6_9EURY|nr:GtrA family protein [Halocatena pleomorpha]RRJ31015.1 GtrA family protein [Halocatena pleomorpha]